MAMRTRRRDRAQEQRAEEMLDRSEHHLDHHIDAVVLRTRIERMVGHLQKARRMSSTSLLPLDPVILDEINLALDAAIDIIDEDAIVEGFKKYPADAPLVDHLGTEA